MPEQLAGYTRRASSQVKKRVLIADDHAFVSWGLAKALSALEDIEILGSVTNGIEAIVEIRKTKPDCAILDYNMPGANGLEVFLESKRWSPETRFILLTGSATPQTVNALVDAGIHGVALKDGTETEIVEIVRQVCAGRVTMGASARRLLETPAASVAVTDRELAVLQAIARGHTNASAAESLGISPKTVDSHRTNLMRKFAVNSTATLVLAAVRAGILEPDSIR
jgi:DNA-binding NarL/FixJ family response regulator